MCGKKKTTSDLLDCSIPRGEQGSIEESRGRSLGFRSMKEKEMDGLGKLR